MCNTQKFSILDFSFGATGKERKFEARFILFKYACGRQKISSTSKRSIAVKELMKKCYVQHELRNVRQIVFT